MNTPFELFGVECDKGWYPLVKEAIKIVARYNGIRPHHICEPVKFTQIKEKYGGLRLYLNYYPKEIIDKIEELEDKSYNICEHCGSTENVETREIYHWLYTCCDKCAEKIKNRI